MTLLFYFNTRVEFEDVHRLSDGQVKHSPEMFYAGSLWKVYNFFFFKVFIMNKQQFILISGFFTGQYSSFQ